MSGGFFNYSHFHVESIANDIEKVIQNNTSIKVNEYGDKLGYFFNEQTIEEFKQAVILLRKAAVYTQRIDWLISGDTSENTFHNGLVEDLQQITF